MDFLCLPPDLAIVAALVVICLIFTTVSCKRQHKRLPPGPNGVPLLRSLFSICTSPSSLHRTLAALAVEYGPVFRFRLGTKLFIVLSSPLVVRQALEEHDSVFGNHHPPEAALAQPSGYTSILWAPQGQLWSLTRKVAVRELLSPHVIQALAPLRQREVHRMIRSLRDKAGGGGMLDRETLLKTVQAVFTSMLWSETLGREDAEIDGEARELMRVMEGIGSVYGDRTISDFFPFLSPLDLQGSWRRLGRLLSEFDIIISAVMERRLNTSQGGEWDNNNMKDLLQIMLGQMGKDDGSEIPFELKHCKSLILEFLIAGTDTTSLAVEWAMAELLRHPHAIAKARQELDEVVGTDALLEETHVPKLRYLESVVKEVLRLHPLGPLLVPYAPTKDCNVGGYTIPKGAIVMVNVWAIHRDPAVWLDSPSQFKPERFFSPSGADVAGSGGGKWNYGGRSFEYLPFGTGMRVCPGMGLALRMVVFMLGSLLHAFEWRVPQGVEVDVEHDQLGLTIKMKNPLQAIPVWRLKQ